MKFNQTKAIIQSVRNQTNTAVLLFSAGGKDGIALVDMLSKNFDNVICYFMYLCPNLRHNQVYVKWAEHKYSNVEVRQIPHYMRELMFKNGFFCDPQPELKVGTEKEIIESIKKETGIDHIFHGMKGVDGFMKRMLLKKMAPYYVKDNGLVYPLALWTNKEVLAYIKTQNLISAMTYGNLKALSQGTGLDYETLSYLKRNYPDDYKKILLEFPYAEQAIISHERKTQTV
jgi:3'-phosphoadenosine 5'-phosphosulfate sulfotransferase (PAPS reductase)/FAD synthetase